EVVYDDFAHHPTAVSRTLETLRARAPSRRLIAVLEPRSNTMRMGAHGDALAAALAVADAVWLYTPPTLDWDAQAVLGPTLRALQVHTAIESMTSALVDDVREGDVVVLMSNGAFGGLRGRLSAALEQRFSPS
ncbi:MAG: cyanophycin synthetase, partial [Pseudomonadota bacterium]